MRLVLVALCIFLLIVLATIATKSPRIIKKKRTRIQARALASIANTGDVLLFSYCAKNVAPSWLRKGLFGCEMTHVGVLFFRHDVPYVWEANMGGEDVRDALTGQEGVSGTQLVPLENRIRKYKGYCVVRCLRPTFASVLGEENVEKVMIDLFSKPKDFCRSKVWIGLMGLSELFGLGRYFPDEHEDDTTCSELTGLTLEALGAYEGVARTKPFSLMMPQHFERTKRIGNRQVVEEYEVVA